MWNSPVLVSKTIALWSHLSITIINKRPKTISLDQRHVHIKYTKMNWKRNQNYLKSTSELWKNVKNSGMVFKLSDDLAIMKFCNGRYIAWWVCNRISEVLARKVVMMHGSCGFNDLFFRDATPYRIASRNCKPSSLPLTFL